MDWKKTCAKSVSTLVQKNTGMSEKDLLNDKKKYHIENMEAAVMIVKECVRKKMKVTVVGDYDADGVTASAIMKLTFKCLGVDAKVRIPKRFSEGYGLNPHIVDEIDSGLLITVDNGITAFEAIEKAKKKGLTVVVTDHHEPIPGGSLPVADIVVDPHAVPGSDFDGYCGAGLAFRFSEYFPETECIRHQLEAIACIGTIADVVPLTWENRRIVKNGLRTLSYGKNLSSGLNALMDASGLEGILDTENIAFKIGPMLNAPGRLYDSGSVKSYELLAFDGAPEKAAAMAKAITEDNEKRKLIVAEQTRKIEANIAANCLYGEIPTVVYEPGLHEGIIGILAGKVSEKYKVPAIVLTDMKDDQGNIRLKGSGRCPDDYDMKKMLDYARGTLLVYGGHKGAAGMQLRLEDLDAFREVTSEEGWKQHDAIDESQKTNELMYDFEIRPAQVQDTLRELDKFGPYGMGNPVPVYKISGFRLFPSQYGFYRTMGDNGQHIKLLGNRMDAVGFDMSQKYHDMKDPRLVDIVGTIGRNTFMGKEKIQILMEDFVDAAKKKEATLLASKLVNMAKNRY